MPAHLRHAAGPLRAPLTAALGSPARVAVLRVLARTGAPLTQRAVARLGGMQVRSAQLALADLTALGLVARIEGGRDVLVQLNRSHHLAEPLAKAFQAEGNLFLRVRERLTRLVHRQPGRKHILSVAVFGSAARGDDALGSDLDVLLVVASERDRDRALDALLAAAEPFRVEFGVRLAPVCWTLAEARRGARAGREPWPGILRDAVTVAGPALRDLLAL